MARSSLISLLRTTKKRQHCVLPADGAQMPASRILSICSSVTSFDGSNLRIERLFLTSSQKFIFASVCLSHLLSYKNSYCKQRLYYLVCVTMEIIELAKAYDPKGVEDKWYSLWVEKGCFTPDPFSKKPAYSIVNPPPNVTGVLTMGHVLNNTLQDILARRARMLGKEVLWLPGTDHAGIATQPVVERELRKEKKTRHDLGRDKFLERVWEWKQKH